MKNDIFLTKFILNKLSCHMCIINFILCLNHIEASMCNPSLRGLRMIRNGHLIENNTQLKKH